MVTVFEVYTTDEQGSVGRSLSAKELNVKETHIETFVVGSVCRVKRFTTGPRNSLKTSGSYT
jgi:hypothetical protein